MKEVLVKLECEHCGGHVEASTSELSESDLSFLCPHCGKVTHIHAIPQIKSNHRPKGDLSTVLKWVLVVWTGLCAIYMTLAGMAVLPEFVREKSGPESVGAFLGVAFGFGTLFLVWAILAVPLFMFWYISKSSKTVSTTG